MIILSVYDYFNDQLNVILFFSSIFFLEHPIKMDVSGGVSGREMTGHHSLWRPGALGPPLPSLPYLDAFINVVTMIHRRTSRENIPGKERGMRGGVTV